MRSLVGNAFVFQKGALYLAIETGQWFLADELNLADPAVLRGLTPLLEGRAQVPVGTDLTGRFA